MKMCHLQCLHTFGILEKYSTNRSQSRRFYLNALYNLRFRQRDLCTNDLDLNLIEPDV